MNKIHDEQNIIFLKKFRINITDFSFYLKLQHDTALLYCYCHLFHNKTHILSSLEPEELKIKREMKD